MPVEEIDGRIIILILFVVISAIKWLIEKIKGPITPPADEDSGDRAHRIPESLENIYEEFREEIRQRQTTTGKRQPAQTPPPIPQSPEPVRRTPTQPTHHAPTWQAEKVALTPEQQAAAARFQQRSSGKRKPSAQTYVRDLLSSPHSTRQAIILSEILGKPKSLQDA